MIHQKNLNLKSFIYKGFTLAEILLVITIIGVVAALTIPNLIQNTQNQQIKAAWKKKYAAISQATQMIIIDRENMMGIDTITPDQLRDLYKEKMSIIRNCNWGDQWGNCWHYNNQWYSETGIPLTTGAINIGKPSVLSDGSFITFLSVSSDCSYANAGWIGNYTICGWIFVDTNGFKKPNTIGKDIIQILITKNGIKPEGYYGDGRPLIHGALLLTQ